jgi:paraquat-inducible protein A
MKIDESRLVRCGICESVNKDDDIYCYRCGSKIYIDIKSSINRAWAFLVTALILYIPANVYPILIGEQFGNSMGNTIIGGIYLLWEEGEYPIALVILIASVLVPLLKFIMLIYLLVNVNINRKAKINPHKIHYTTEIIGPWSMVDVFVVAILTGLVQMTAISILAGSGATAFVLMVLFTMFAALSIDVRVLKGVK